MVPITKRARLLPFIERSLVQPLHNDTSNLLPGSLFKRPHPRVQLHRRCPRVSPLLTIRRGGLEFIIGQGPFMIFEDQVWASHETKPPSRRTPSCIIMSIYTRLLNSMNHIILQNSWPDMLIEPS